MNKNHIPNLPLTKTVIDLFNVQAAKTPNKIAAEWQGKTITYSALQNASLHVSKALLTAGVQPRATVPLLTHMSLEMLPAIIGILRVGASYAPMDVAAWSGSRIEAALSTLGSPVTVVTTPCPGLQLPVFTVNFQEEWLFSLLETVDELSFRLDALREGFQDDYLAWILFTSGTTGKPKGVMVYHTGAYAYSMFDLLQHSEDIQPNANEGIRFLLAFSVGFDGCASVIWTTLTKGHTLVMASPSDFPEVATTCDVLMLTPSMLSILDPARPYDHVSYIFMGAEDPSMDVVREWIRPNRKIYTTYGPTETTCFLTVGELKPDEEITLGQLMPGFQMVLVDEHLQECERHGEILIAGPGVAAGYFDNPELTAKKFIHWNGERFYRTGDFARRTENGQLVWGGRADSLVKNRGFLINLESEVEPALLSFSPVRLAVALKWRDRLVAYVQPATVDIEKLRGFIKQHFDPFVIPDEILAMDTFPLNSNGKVDRHALTAQLEKRVTEDGEGMLDDGHLVAYDALRWAFSKCLHVAIRELNKDSSFMGLGGNSFAALRLSNFLRKRGYVATGIQILRLDTIRLLEENLKSLSSSDQSPGQHDIDPGYVSEEAQPITGSQKIFLTRSLESPAQCCLIGTTNYIGDPLTVPTANELHTAFVKALSAHSIFQTRFDLTNFTLSDLGRLNLDWHEVSVEEAEFENSCLAAEEKAWLDLNEVTRANNEVPYYHVTCISVPNRKALAFITRIHHVLVDVFAQAMISQDVDRALVGEEVPAGPKIQDFARFMYNYKRDNLERAISTFEKMVKPLPVTSVLQPPSPQTRPLEQAFDLIRLNSPTSLHKSVLDASARAYCVTTGTMVYAAWALFLSRITSWDRVGFRVSLSGRTVPWPSAQSIVGCLVDSAPFSTSVPTRLTVHEWLAEVHKTNLDVLEFDGLAFSLPESLRLDPRTNTTNVLCFLDMPQPTTSNWTYKEKQRHNYLMDWYVFQEGEYVATIFEIQSRHVDLNWAKEVASVPGKMLEALVDATKETLVGDLLR